MGTGGVPLIQSSAAGTMQGNCRAISKAGLLFKPRHINVRHAAGLSQPQQSIKTGVYAARRIINFCFIVKYVFFFFFLLGVVVLVTVL